MLMQTLFWTRILHIGNYPTNKFTITLIWITVTVLK